MSRQRLRVLDIIKAEVAATGRWPTARMIADEMEWKTTSGVRDSLTAMVRYGWIKRVRNDGPMMQRYEILENSNRK
jgi:SOS-response transcriptional repressor LexA